MKKMMEPFVYHLHISTQESINVALCGYEYGDKPCGWKDGDVAVLQSVKPCKFVHMLVYEQSDNTICEECLAHEDYPLLVLGDFP